MTTLAADPPATTKTGTDSTAPTTALSDSMAELDSLAAENIEPAPAAKTKPEPKPKTKPAPAEELEGTDDDLDPTGATPPKPKDAPQSEPDKPVKAAELRQAYDKTKETLKQRDAEIARLNGELRVAKESPRTDPEKPALLGKLETAEARVKALEEKLRFVDFQQSDEFVNKFQKPLDDAWQKAASDIQELVVELEDGQQRGATVHDLVALSQMKLHDARQYANKMFGEGADDVMAHLRTLRNLSDAHRKALDEAKVNSEAHFKKQSEESLQARQKAATLWKDENSAWATRYPKFFAPTDGDTEGNALLTKGYQMVDRGFSGKGQKGPNGEAPLTDEERVKLHAEIRNKAAAFPRLALQFKRARARIAELEKALKEFEDSEPPAGGGGKGRPAREADELTSAYQELDDIAKKNA